MSERGEKRVCGTDRPSGLEVEKNASAFFEESVRAFQPSRSLSAIMNKVRIDSQYFHLETMLKSRHDLRSIYKSPKYDDDIKTWMMFGGDNEQFATLKNVEWCKKMDKLIAGF